MGGGVHAVGRLHAPGDLNLEGGEFIPCMNKP